MNLGNRTELVRLAAPALALLLIAHSGCGSQADAIFDEQPDGVTSEQESEGFDSQGEDGGPTDDIMEPLAAEDQDDVVEEKDLGPMERSTLADGCDLIEGEYWEEDDEYGCVLESGNELLCNDGGACVPAVTMSLDDILAQLGILEYYPSILELREIAVYNNGEGPVTQPGEFIEIEDDGWCSSPGNVFVEVNGTTECQCDSGFLEIGTEAGGDPMCGLDWHDGGGDPPPPPPQPDPPPGPSEPDSEPPCTDSELLRDLERAEQDYVKCITGAVDSLQSSLQLATIALGTGILTLGTSAGIVIGELGATTLGGLSLSNDYDSAKKSCEYDFCTSIKRTLEDCNVPVPADSPDKLCDENW